MSFYHATIYYLHASFVCGPFTRRHLASFFFFWRSWMGVGCIEGLYHLLLWLPVWNALALLTHFSPVFYGGSARARRPRKWWKGDAFSNKLPSYLISLVCMKRLCTSNEPIPYTLHVCPYVLLSTEIFAPFLYIRIRKGEEKTGCRERTSKPLVFFPSFIFFLFSFQYLTFSYTSTVFDFATR